MRSFEEISGFDQYFLSFRWFWSELHHVGKRACNEISSVVNSVSFVISGVFDRSAMHPFEFFFGMIAFLQTLFLARSDVGKSPPPPNPVRQYGS